MLFRHSSHVQGDILMIWICSMIFMRIATTTTVVVVAAIASIHPQWISLVSPPLFILLKVTTITTIPRSTTCWQLLLPTSAIHTVTHPDTWGHRSTALLLLLLPEEGWHHQFLHLCIGAIRSTLLEGDIIMEDITLTTPILIMLTSTHRSSRFVA